MDENRVVLSGVSDGGTGTYYIAMRDTTPYASFLPLNGFMMILQNPSLGLTEGAVKMAAHRLRGRYRQLLRDEIGRTVADPAEIDGEIAALLAAIGT